MSVGTEHPTHCHSNCNNNFVTETSVRNIFVKLHKYESFEIFVYYLPWRYGTPELIALIYVVI